MWTYKTGIFSVQAFTWTFMHIWKQNTGKNCFLDSVELYDTVRVRNGFLNMNAVLEERVIKKGVCVHAHTYSSRSLHRFQLFKHQNGVHMAGSFLPLLATDFELYFSLERMYTIQMFSFIVTCILTRWSEEKQHFPFYFLAQ